MTRKVWGETTAVAVGPNFEVHHLRVVPGGYCSIHRHRKFNQFFITSGELEVVLYSDDRTSSRVHRVAAGQSLTVSPYQIHQFRNTSGAETTLIETYWNASIDPEDIERFSEGGISQ